jgi:hypothetical protein
MQEGCTPLHIGAITSEEIFLQLLAMLRHYVRDLPSTTQQVGRILSTTATVCALAHLLCCIVEFEVMLVSVAERVDVIACGSRVGFFRRCP